MRELPWIAAETYRWRDPPDEKYHNNYGDDFGVFRVPFPKTGTVLMVIASSGMGWEHVSVSLPNRCPNWPEMDAIKQLFWRDDEAVMQLHVPKSDHRNVHPYCLHLWRPTGEAIPLPPGWMVGNMNADQEREMDAAFK